VIADDEDGGRRTAAKMFGETIARRSAAGGSLERQSCSPELAFRSPAAGEEDMDGLEDFFGPLMGVL